MVGSGSGPIIWADRPSTQLRGRGEMDTDPKTRPTDADLEKAVFEAP